MTQSVVSVDRGHVRYMSPESQKLLWLALERLEIHLEGGKKESELPQGQSGFFQVELKHKRSVGLRGALEC